MARICVWKVTSLCQSRGRRDYFSRWWPRLQESRGRGSNMLRRVLDLKVGTRYRWSWEWSRNSRDRKGSNATSVSCRYRHVKGEDIAPGEYMLRVSNWSGCHQWYGLRNTTRTYSGAIPNNRADTSTDITPKKKETFSRVLTTFADCHEVTRDCIRPDTCPDS